MAEAARSHFTAASAAEAWRTAAEVPQVERCWFAGENELLAAVATKDVARPPVALGRRSSTALSADSALNAVVLPTSIGTCSTTPVTVYIFERVPMDVGT
jgi:hypothetical protein